MSSIHCYTSVSFSYLSRARVLAETVRKYHPDWTLWICISDREPDGFTFDIEDEQFDHVLWMEEFPNSRTQIVGLQAQCGGNVHRSEGICLK